jgi:hypothetical protein
VQPTQHSAAEVTSSPTAFHALPATMTQTQTAVQVKTPNNELHVDVVKDAPILTPSSGQVRAWEHRTVCEHVHLSGHEQPLQPSFSLK